MGLSNKPIMQINNNLKIYRNNLVLIIKKKYN